jgi:hypothetical protein
VDFSLTLCDPRSATDTGRAADWLVLAVRFRLRRVQSDSPKFAALAPVCAWLSLLDKEGGDWDNGWHYPWRCSQLVERDVASGHRVNRRVQLYHDIAAGIDEIAAPVILQ